MAEVNHVKTEADQRSLHSDHFVENADEIFDLNNLSSPDYNQSIFWIGFGLKDFRMGPATLHAEENEFEHQSNMQHLDSFILLDYQRIKEFYSSTELLDWNDVLNYILK